MAGPNAFISNALGAAVEIPPYLVLVLLLDPWGRSVLQAVIQHFIISQELIPRRPLFTLSLLLAALSCFAAAASPASSSLEVLLLSPPQPSLQTGPLNLFL